MVTADLIEQVFGLRSRMIADPDTGDPVILPRSVVAPAPGGDWSVVQQGRPQDCDTTATWQ